VESTNINSLQPGDEVNGVFAVRSKKLLPYRDGTGCFLGLTLADKTGQVEGRVWENAEEVNKCCRAGDVVRVTGRAVEYKGSVQLNLTTVEKCPGDEVVPERFIPSTGASEEKVRDAWLDIVSTIGNPHLKQLQMLMANDRNLLRCLAASPAAKRNHHAKLGGLWEHSLGMVKAAEGMAAAYSQVNRDLLITGALLHDIGKIEEFRARADIEYTDAGRLLGHIILGVELVSRYIAKVPGFPKTLRLKLLHMIVSHHGQYEWQSPKRPKFLEAVILHQLDMIDAQVDMFTEAAAGRDDNEDSWSGWVRGLDRYVFCG
jgi:3'-5' exoribonuclease